MELDKNIQYLLSNRRLSLSQETLIPLRSSSHFNCKILRNNSEYQVKGPQKSTDTTTNQCYALIAYDMATRTRYAIKRLPSVLDVQLSDTPN